MKTALHDGPPHLKAAIAEKNVTLIDSLTAQKRLAQAGFGLALVPESSVRDELRRGVLVGAGRAGSPPPEWR